MKLEFEWDETKASDNYKKHGISFDLATKVFEDPFALEFIDDRQDHPEERFVILGMAGSDLVYVAYTERESRIRLISARRAAKYEEEHYFQQNS
jgi:uncharacterized DUF497 family protein